MVLPRWQPEAVVSSVLQDAQALEAIARESGGGSSARGRVDESIRRSKHLTLHPPPIAAMLPPAQQCFRQQMAGRAEALLYLDDGWKGEWGGELRINRGAGGPPVDVTSEHQLQT